MLFPTFFSSGGDFRADLLEFLFPRIHSAQSQKKPVLDGL